MILLRRPDLSQFQVWLHWQTDSPKHCPEHRAQKVSWYGEYLGVKVYRRRVIISDHIFDSCATDTLFHWMWAILWLFLSNYSFFLLVRTRQRLKTVTYYPESLCCTLDSKVKESCCESQVGPFMRQSKSYKHGKQCKRLKYTYCYNIWYITNVYTWEMKVWLKESSQTLCDT
jgi:hypothetical protein